MTAQAGVQMSVNLLFSNRQERKKESLFLLSEWICSSRDHKKLILTKVYLIHLQVEQQTHSSDSKIVAQQRGTILFYNRNVLNGACKINKYFCAVTILYFLHSLCLFVVTFLCPYGLLGVKL